MDEDVLLLIVEESSAVYNIKHRAFYFAKEAVLFIGKQKYERIYFSMFDQLVRSVTSIGANLVEGIAGSSKADFLKFNVIALKSANNFSVIPNSYQQKVSSATARWLRWSCLLLL